jgi:hypothetical protein
MLLENARAQIDPDAYWSAYRKARGNAMAQDSAWQSRTVLRNMVRAVMAGEGERWLYGKALSAVHAHYCEDSHCVGSQARAHRAGYAKEARALTTAVLAGVVISEAVQA